MKHKVFALVGILACLSLAVAGFAQGDAVSGTWTGDWGPSAGDRNRVTLDLKWDGKALSGNITGGDNVSQPIPLKVTAYDPKTGAVKMEATATGRRGQVNYVVEGKIEKGAMSGTWTHDNRKGDFKLTRK